MGADALAQDVLDRCSRAGFALAGIATLEPAARRTEWERWLAEGCHGSMHWLAETVATRLHPATMLHGARAAVMVADFYAQRPDPSARSKPPAIDTGQSSTSIGRIARYARGRDYHDVIKRRLRRVCDHLRAQHPDHRFRVFADTAPVPERELALRAGLGWVGKHTLIIHPRLGSWMVLGGFLTTLDLARTTSPQVPDHCGACTRCIDACPTGAITPYRVDAQRCVSYLTIERDLAIEPALRPGLGEWIAGCDVCQEVCPHNSPTARDAASHAQHNAQDAYKQRREGFDLLEVLGWDESTRRARFATSALKRITLAQAKRNAIIALANRARKAPPADRGRARAAIDDLRWDAKQSVDLRTLAQQLTAELDRRERRATPEPREAPRLNPEARSALPAAASDDAPHCG